MKAQEFVAELEASTTGDGGHWVTVPGDVMAALTQDGRVKVRATFDGVQYRGSIVKYAGAFRLGVTKAIVAEARLRAGQPVEVMVKVDQEERTVDVPRDLIEALEAAGARAAWGALSLTVRREDAAAVAIAKRPETKERRIAAIVERVSRNV